MRTSVLLKTGATRPAVALTARRAHRDAPIQCGALAGERTLVSSPNLERTRDRHLDETPGPIARSYPWIDHARMGVQRVHADPPVYLVHNLLPDEACEALISGAQAGVMAPLKYENAVLLDTHRLWPLLLVVAAGAAFDTFRSDAATTQALWQVAAAAALRWGVGIAGLVGAVHMATRHAIGGRVFTGTKWSVASLFKGPSSGGSLRGGGEESSSAVCAGMDEAAAKTASAAAAAARAAARCFIDETAALLGTPPDHLEPPTVTRYQTGEQQRVHFDGRPSGDPRLGDFMASGGQRLVQVVTYLTTLQPEEGGGTRFHHPLLGNLTIQPKRGTALVFFPAFADGTLDSRMAHSGQPVAAGGAEKWIVNTWACQMPVPSAVDACPVDSGAELQAVRK